MKIVYVGPSAEGVKVADTGQVARPGEPIDVPDELAERLLEQDIWQPAPDADDQATDDRPRSTGRRGGKPADGDDQDGQTAVATGQEEN